ncbi:MAG TPA: hypothetical protein VHJ20_18045 [Polyangia bacterium]|nr:hypothetical protein [Polyangia bacterium]
MPRLPAVAALLAVTLALAGCTGFPKPGRPQQCGDPCATMTCPDGMRCTVSGNCAPTCEVLPYPMH